MRHLNDETQRRCRTRSAGSDLVESADRAMYQEKFSAERSDQALSRRREALFKRRTI